jgi:N-acetylmuramoyl-L-alanine amidase
MRVWAGTMKQRASACVATGVLIAGCGSSVTHQSAQTTVSTTRAAAVVISTTTTTATSSAPATSTATATRAHHAEQHVAKLPLSGETVGIDPGHNGRNYTDPGYIDHLIWNGREQETCNTTGTETDGGYTEALFNFRVASDLSADLRAQGARVVMTRHNNDGVGPCVNVRAQIINRSHANVAIDIHADGGPPDGRGVAILEPVADGPNDHIIGAAKRFGHDVLHQMETFAHMPPSTYDGVDGISFRDDLAGMNLTRVPEVLIESGNMRNATDAALLTSTAWQHREAFALDRAIRHFLGS